jgi:hypothetical protein
MKGSGPRNSYTRGGTLPEVALTKDCLGFGQNALQVLPDRLYLLTTRRAEAISEVKAEVEVETKETRMTKHVPNSKSQTPNNESNPSCKLQSNPPRCFSNVGVGRRRSAVSTHEMRNLRHLRLKHDEARMTNVRASDFLLCHWLLLWHHEGHEGHQEDPCEVALLPSPLFIQEEWPSVVSPTNWRIWKVIKCSCL